MAVVDVLRNELIGKLLTISNKEYLGALNKIVEKAETNVVKFTAEQRLMIEMSEDDLKHGRTISNEELNKQDLAWLKEM